MKRNKLLMASGLSLLLLAGCTSNAAPADTTQKETTTDQAGTADKTQNEAKTETKTDETAKNDATASDTTKKDTTKTDTTSGKAAVTQAGESLKKAFEDAGYATVPDKNDINEYEFKVETTNGRIDVEVDSYNADAGAIADYMHDTDLTGEDDEELVNAYESGDRKLTIIRDLDDSEFTIYAVDVKTNLTYSLGDINIADLDDILVVLQNAGFPTE